MPDMNRLEILPWGIGSMLLERRGIPLAHHRPPHL